MIQFGLCEEIKAKIMQREYYFDVLCEDVKAENVILIRWSL